MTIVASLVVVAFAATLLALVTSLLRPEPVTLDLPEPYQALHRVVGGELPERPAGKAAMKAALADVTVPLPPAEPAKLPDTRPHVDWRFDSQEFRIAWQSWFAEQPDDLAVARPWAGAGRAS